MQKLPTEKRQAQNVLLLDYELTHWTKSFAQRLKRYSVNVSILYVYGKPNDPIPGVTEFKLADLSPGLNQVNFKVFEKFLIENKIQMILQHGFRTRRAVKLSEYIHARNCLIENGDVAKDPIDLFYFEGGFLRPGLEQLDAVGVNYESSYLDFKETSLNAKEEIFLDRWLENFRRNKRVASFTTGGTASPTQYMQRSDLFQKFAIDPKKKIVFCPLQKPGDSVIREFAPWCNTPNEFIEKVRVLFKNRSEYHVVFRKHPEDRTQSDTYEMLSSTPNLNETFLGESERGISTASFMDAADIVCVVNSTAGCEALAFDKVVITFGYAAYQECSIPFHGQEPEKIAKVFDEISLFSRRRGKVRALLHHIIRTSTGVLGHPLHEVINFKSSYFTLPWVDPT